MTKKKLTPKMLAFADCVALEGLSLSESYRRSYDAENMSAAAVHTEASLLASNPAMTRTIYPTMRLLPFTKGDFDVRIVLDDLASRRDSTPPYGVRC